MLRSRRMTVFGGGCKRKSQSNSSFLLAVCSAGPRESVANKSHWLSLALQKQTGAGFRYLGIGRVLRDKRRMIDRSRRNGRVGR